MMPALEGYAHQSEGVNAGRFHCRVACDGFRIGTNCLDASNSRSSGLKPSSSSPSALPATEARLLPINAPGGPPISPPTAPPAIGKAVVAMLFENFDQLLAGGRFRELPESGSDLVNYVAEKLFELLVAGNL